MKRVLLFLFGLLIVIIAGGYIYLQSNLEMITAAISKAVESATGKPLVLDSPPGLSVFPQLGLDVGKARWGDSQKDEVCVTFDRAMIRVDFMALLSKRIDVSEIVLDTPRMVYRPGAGQSREQSGLEEAAPAQPKPAENKGASSSEPGLNTWSGLTLNAVRITNGDVRVIQPGKTLRLSGLDMTLTDFAAGKTGKLQFIVRVALRESGKLTEADVSLKTSFAPQYPVVKLRDCALKLTPLKGLPITSPVSLSGGVDVDTAIMSLSQMDIAIDFAGSNLKAKGQVAMTGPSGQLDIALRGPLRETLAACGVALNTQDPRALSALDLSSKVKLNGGQVELSDLKGKLDDTTLGGNLSASESKISGALKLGSLNVDRYLPEAAAGGGTSGSSGSSGSYGGATRAGSSASAGNASSASRQGKPASASAAGYPEVRLDLAVETLKVNNLLIAGLKALVQGKAGQYALDPCTFRFYESAVSLAARAQLVEQVYSLKITANGLNAGALLKDAAKVDKVEGKINAQADLSMRGADESAIKRSLGGTARLTGQLNVDSGLLPSDWGQLIRDVKTINVNNIDVVAKADKGRVVLKPILADGQVKVNGQGVVDLPSDSLDIRLDTTLAGLTLPLLVRGTLKNPSYGIDPAGALKNILESPKANQAIERGLKGLMKKF